MRYLTHELQWIEFELSNELKSQKSEGIYDISSLRILHNESCGTFLNVLLT